MNINTSNPENNFLNSIKQFPSLIFGSLNQNPGTCDTYNLLQIQILRIEITHNLKIADFSPYISIKIANETKKTMTNSQREPYNAVFNEFFEFKNVPMKNHVVITLHHKSNFLFSDKYIGHSLISLDNPLLINFRKLTLLNENEKNDKLIGYLYIKISIEGDNNPISESKNQNTKSKAYISEIMDEVNASKDKTNRGLGSKMENKDKINNTLKEESYRKINKNNNMSQMNFKEIERIYFELNEEKKKNRIQEHKIKKFNNLLKKKEIQLEEQKSKIQKNKDLLTEEENSLVSEKEKCKERVKMINKEKEAYIENQNKIKLEISRLEATNIKHKLRGGILLKKLNDQTKYMNEINDQIYCSSESLHHFTEKQSYVTMSYIDPDHLGNEIEIFYNKNEEKLSKKEEKNCFFKNHKKSNSLEIYPDKKKGMSMDHDFAKFKHDQNKYDEKKQLIMLVKEEKNKQKNLISQLTYFLKEEKKVFENYQKYLKISTSYTPNNGTYTYSNSPYSEGVKNESNSMYQNQISTYSFSNHYNNSNNEDRIMQWTSKDGGLEKEKYLTNMTTDNKAKENKFSKIESSPYFDKNQNLIFNLDNYSQPISLPPKEIQKNNDYNEQKYPISSIQIQSSNDNLWLKNNNLPKSSGSYHLQNQTGINETSLSSQLFNDYFIKNSLNK